MIRRIFIILAVILLKVSSLFSQENYGTIVISEVYFDTRYNENINDRYHHMGEFIELYNSSNEAINIERWKIMDGHTEFEIPQGYIIDPGKFIIIAYNGGWEYQFSHNKLIELFPEIEDYEVPYNCFNECIIMQDSFILYNLADKVELYDDTGGLRSSISYLNNPVMSVEDRQNTLNYLSIDGFDCEVNIDNGDGGVFNGAIADEGKLSLHRNSPSSFYVNGEENPNINVAIATPFSITFELPLLPLDPSLNIYLSNDKNYVHEIIYQEPYNVYEVNEGIPLSKTLQKVNYYDGLGRDLQSRAIACSPNQKDIVVHHEYDDYGRKAKDYLAYPSESYYRGKYENNAYTFTTDYYQSQYGQSNPFTETIFENSPDNRVIKQGFPGDSWAVNLASDNDKTIKKEYGFNTDETGEYKVRKFSVNFSLGNIEFPNLVDNNEYYLANELYLTVSKNENWTAGKNKTVEEYRNRENQIILIRAFNNNVPHDTYNVYDDYGNLTYSISPKVLLDDGVSLVELNTLCYQYVYDNQFRLVEKKLPGKGSEYIIYDTLDRPILTQDSRQRELSIKEWNFTKFDVFGKPAYTGIYKNNETRTDLQNYVTSNINNGAIDLFESRTITPTQISSDPTTIIYYTTNAFPNSGERTIYAINYYDSYIFNIPTELGSPIEVFGQEVFTNVVGLESGAKTRILGTNNWLTSVVYYDYKSRPIFNGSKNDYLNSVSINKTKLDFLGRSVESETYHRKGTTIPIICNNKFNYDHFGRLISQSKSINDGVEKLIFQNTYDELGKLMNEKINPKSQPPLFLTNDFGVTIVDNYVLKTSPNSWDNAAFTSDSTLSGNGYVEFEVPNTTYYTILGLSNPNTLVHYSSIKYAIYTYGGNLRVIHNGIQSSHGTYQGGDRLRVERANGKIVYKKNNVVFYEAVTNDFSDLIVDACLFHNNAQIDNVIFKSNGLQHIDYDYNIRNWTTSINDVDSLGDDLFALKINFDQTDYISTHALYNGDISEVLWNTSSIDPTNGESQVKRAYIYSYDDLTRIVEGVFKKEGGVNHNGFFNLNEVIYDKNSNISTLKRSGVHPTTNAFLSDMDNLTYSYDGNQLTDVLEQGHHYVGFIDKDNTQTGDYLYDSNGNLKKDINKDIESIEYNYLNLPTRLDFGSLGSIEYIYTANGAKIEKKVIIQGSGSQILHYDEGFIYRNGTLNFFPQEKGYIIPETESFKYVFQYKDQLGSVRLSYTDENDDGFVLNDEIIEENNYHPFGLKHYGYNSNITSSGNDIANRFKFNGKELDVSLGLTTYDFGARNYDPAIARWSNIDNYSEKFKGLSPYNYAVNNPISVIDPDGNLPVEVSRNIQGQIANMYQQRANTWAYQRAYQEYEASAGWESGQIDAPWTQRGMSQGEYMAAMNNPGDYNAMMSAYSGPSKGVWSKTLNYVSSQSTGNTNGGFNFSKQDGMQGLEMITGSKDWTDGTLALINGNYGKAAKHYAWGSSGFILRGAPVALGRLGRFSMLTSSSQMGDDIAFGLGKVYSGDDLFTFARNNNFKTYRDFSTGRQLDKIQEAIFNTNNRLHFNLDGFSRTNYNSFKKLYNPSSPYVPVHHTTNWELYNILNSQSVLNRTTFYRYGSPTSIPNF